MGLYGTKEKYTHGAIRNAEMAKIYYPGWVCRYYVTSDVPHEVISQLEALGAEIFKIPRRRLFQACSGDSLLLVMRQWTVTSSETSTPGQTVATGWRWRRIQSDYPVHIERDHVNHCIPMNGGMWGG